MLLFEIRYRLGKIHPALYYTVDELRELASDLYKRPIVGLLFDELSYAQVHRLRQLFPGPGQRRPMIVGKGKRCG
jgi:hypothetical protein